MATQYLIKFIDGSVTLCLRYFALLLHLLHKLKHALDLVKVFFGSCSRCEGLIRQH